MDSNVLILAPSVYTYKGPAIANMCMNQQFLIKFGKCCCNIAQKTTNQIQFCMNIEKVCELCSGCDYYIRLYQ